MSRQLTIRGVSEELNRRLVKLGKSRGDSLNTTALRLLEEAVGIDARRERLSRYMTWTETDRAEFDDALKSQRGIDRDLWQ